MPLAPYPGQPIPHRTRTTNERWQPNSAMDPRFVADNMPPTASASLAGSDNNILPPNPSAKTIPSEVNVGNKPSVIQYSRVPPLRDPTGVDPQFLPSAQIPQVLVAGMALSQLQGHGELTNKDHMLLGYQYYPHDLELRLDRARCTVACLQFNNFTMPLIDSNCLLSLDRLFLNILRPDKPVWLSPTESIPTKGMGHVGRNVNVERPFTCDYGYNICIGDNVRVSSNCTINDAGKVELGNNCVIGPKVLILTDTVLAGPSGGREGAQLAMAVIAGPGCWIGGGATISPGCTIGERSIIGAGSTATEVC